MCAEKHTHPTERRVVRTIPLSQIYSIYKYIRNDIYKSRQCVRHTTKKAINEESSTQEERGFAKPLSTVQFLHAVDPWVERADVRPFVGRGPGSIAASAPERV